MRNRGQLILGGILVLFGLLSLLSVVFNINLSGLCWPIGLIAVGTWLVLRPRMVSGRAVEMNLLGGLRRRGSWTVQNEEIWVGVGDVELDLTEAVIPPGETQIHIYSFVGDVKVTAPQQVGVSAQVSAFVGDAHLFGQKYETLFTSAEAASDNYVTADCRVRIEQITFINDMKVQQV